MLVLVHSRAKLGHRACSQNGDHRLTEGALQASAQHVQGPRLLAPDFNLQSRSWQYELFVLFLFRLEFGIVFVVLENSLH